MFGMESMKINEKAKYMTAIERMKIGTQQQQKNYNMNGDMFCSFITF